MKELKNPTGKLAPRKKATSRKARARTTSRRSSEKKASPADVVYSDVRRALQSSILRRLL
jgi:hypothetical protein